MGSELNVFSEIERLKNNIQQLRQNFPDCRAVEDPISIIEKIPSKVPMIDGKLVLVTAFCGPSGAGKSTLFNLLTGLNSPAGVKRPTSFGSLVAIPQEIFEKEEKTAFLPSFKIDRLKSPEDLKDENIPKNKLFIKSYDMKYGGKNNWIYVADIPDFNSIAMSNWEKTEEMLKRADSIIFVSTQEGYSDRKTIEYFIKVLKNSGKVIYLLTRIEAEESNDFDKVAQDILGKYLINAVKMVNPVAVAHLDKCLFYYSPNSKKPSLGDIRPYNNKKDFIDEIFTNQTKETILEKYCLSVRRAAELSELVCDKARISIKEEKDFNNFVVNQIIKEADYIVGDEIPLFKILFKIIDEINIRRYELVKSKLKSLGSKLFFFIPKNKKESSETIKEEVSQIKNSSGERIEAEEKRLLEAIEHLFTQWLSNEKAHGNMIKRVPAEDDRAFICRAYRVALPVKDQGYIDDIIKTKMNEGLDDDKMKVKAKIANALLASGGALTALDLIVDGGLGTLGMISLAGLGGILGSEMMNFFDAIGLQPVLKKIQNDWLQKRKEEYVSYLTEFAKKLVLENIDLDYLDGILKKSLEDIKLLKDCKPSSFDRTDGEKND